MSLNTTDLKHIANLAKLSIAEGELEQVKKDLSNLLSFVDTMNSVDTQEIAPLAHPYDQTQRLRPDVITEDNQRECYMQNAPSATSGLFLVPKVLDSE